MLGNGISRARRAEHGQVLLIAVLVLLGVATLAALFAAIVGSQIVQVTRYADVTALRNAAEAGLWFANEQLVYSKAGADWRPDKTLQVGKCLVTLKVSYGPTPTELQKRFLLVSATATFGRDNPFLSYTVLGVKPLLLTDYARFVTDRYELRQLAALGVTGVELAGSPRDYTFTLSGPIRSNTNLAWYGASQVNLFNSDGVFAGSSTWRDLGVLRDDRIEVAGQMRSGALTTDQTALAGQPLQLTVNGVSRATNLFAPQDALETFYYRNGFTDQADFQAIPNTWRVLTALPSYQPTFGDPLTPPDLSVPRVNPPRMDAVDTDMNTNRYLSLTRDSGEWLYQGGAWHNRGEYGWGWVDYGGIYVDNGSEIQYGHDLEKLRLNWVGGHGVPGADGRTGVVAPGNWWDKTGRYYAPPGVEIILHGESPNCPYIEMIRHDLKTAQGGYYWKDWDGNPIKADGSVPVRYPRPTGKCGRPAQDVDLEVVGPRAFFPFPPNGVIYAEGNVRVKGVMPPARHAPDGYFKDDLGKTGTWDRSRRFDLQIVSGGTIYVEGDLLTPLSAGLQPIGMSDPLARMQWDQESGSRVALIARDYVCLNTTALHPRPTNLYFRDENGGVTEDSYNDSYPIYPPEDSNGYPPYLLFQGDTDEALNQDASASAATAARQATEPGTIAFDYYNVRMLTPTLRGSPYLAELRLLLGHSGWYTPDDPAGTPGTQTKALEHARAAVEVEMRLNGTVQNWDNDSPTYTFKSAGNAPADGSEHWYLEPDRTDPFNDTDPCDYLEFQPGTQSMGLHDGDGDLLLTGIDRLQFSSWITPVWNEDSDNPAWIIRPRELGYVLGPVAITPPRGADPLPVRVEAMVYAQNGSWFILPGPWFNEDPDSPVTVTDEDYPIYHEPLNLQLSFYGAIAENMPAPPGDVADWTSKWAGPSGATGYLTYEYDPLLRWATRQDASGRLYPRFPNLPLTTDLLIWGERVSGY